MNSQQLGRAGVIAFRLLEGAVDRESSCFVDRFL
jgi:hypothetical protein